MSGQYGQPDWTTASSAAPAVVETTTSTGWAATGGEDFSGGSNPNAGGLGNRPRGKKNCFQYLLSIFSIGLSAMMCCLGVFGILDRSGELAVIFVSVYMILFSVLLFLYELMWWKSIPAINKNLRTNFGFLYGIKGKAAYLIFVAFLVIGLQSDQSIKYLRYATGACYLGTGIGMLFLHFSKPELLGRYEAPTAGFEDQAAPATAQV